jgi:hypothetical protein
MPSAVVSDSAEVAALTTMCVARRVATWMMRAHESGSQAIAASAQATRRAQAMKSSGMRPPATRFIALGWCNAQTRHETERELPTLGCAPRTDPVAVGNLC